MVGLPSRSLHGPTRGCGERTGTGDLAHGCQEMDTGDCSRHDSPVRRHHAAGMDALLVCGVDIAGGCPSDGRLINHRSSMAEPAIDVGRGYVDVRYMVALDSLDV